MTDKYLNLYKIKKDFEQIFTDKNMFKYVRSDFINDLLDKIAISNNNIMFGIIGETASGKTTLSKTIENMFLELDISATFLKTDNYFKDISKIRNGKDFVELVLYDGYDSDSPNGIQMDVLTTDLQKLKNGTNIYSPTYALDNTGKSIPNSLFVKSNKLIFIEGVACSYLNIPDFFDVKIYVDIDEKIRKERFYKRSAERLMFGENVDKYWDYVCGCGKKYIQPLKEKSDIIINGNSDVNKIKEIVLEIYKYLIN